MVSERVDDGVEEGVALGQNQEVLLEAQHLTHVAAQAVQQQDHQARRPAQHETACPEGKRAGLGGVRPADVLRFHSKFTDEKGSCHERTNRGLKNV